MELKRLWQLAREIRRMPQVSIDLMCAAAADNDPFFERIVRQHYREARRFHRRYLVVRQMVHAVAVNRLPESFDKYFASIEGSARRNFRKARREGCEVRRIAFNEHLDDVAAIRASMPMRQGRPMPPDFVNGEVGPVSDPPSRSPLHDYPYFGVFRNGKMISYCAALVAGEFAGIEQILGHAEHAWLCPVPLLIIELARHLLEHHPQVKYYGYGMYFGASRTMQRFKRKFDFYPHSVEWLLGEKSGESSVMPTRSPEGDASAKPSRS